jgi:hypothetical protein
MISHTLSIANIVTDIQYGSQKHMLLVCEKITLWMSKVWKNRYVHVCISRLFANFYGENSNFVASVKKDKLSIKFGVMIWCTWAPVLSFSKKNENYISKVWKYSHVANYLSYQHVKNLVQILCILGYTKIKKM